MFSFNAPSDIGTKKTVVITYTDTNGISQTTTIAESETKVLRLRNTSAAQPATGSSPSKGSGLVLQFQENTAASFGTSVKYILCIHISSIEMHVLTYGYLFWLQLV